MNIKHLDRLIGPVHNPCKQPPVDGPAQCVPGSRGLRRAEVGDQDLATVPHGGGGGNGATREAVVELLYVALEDFTSVVEL